MNTKKPYDCILGPTTELVPAPQQHIAFYRVTKTFWEFFFWWHHWVLRKHMSRATFLWATNQLLDDEKTYYLPTTYRERLMTTYGSGMV